MLLVEGDDDVRSLELMLTRLTTADMQYDWSQDWVLAAAGSKTAVIEILRHEQNWLGVVDRDEWDADKIRQLTSEVSNLCFLPRFCIENYLILPDELWQALPEKQKAKIELGKDALQQEILRDLDRWVKHGVLWSVVNPLWEGLRSRGFKERLLQVDAVNDERVIRDTLQEWHDFLNPDDIWQRYQLRLADVQKTSDREKLTLHIHGKKFYQGVVDPALNRLLGTKKRQDRQFSIVRTLPVMSDLQPILRKMQARAANSQL